MQMLQLITSILDSFFILIGRITMSRSLSTDRGVADEPPAKMISPTKTTTVSGSKTKRARKAAAKIRIAAQDAETAESTTTTETAVTPTSNEQKHQPSHQPCLNRRNIGANWQQAMAGSKPPAQNVKMSASKGRNTNPYLTLPIYKNGIRITKYIAMDCEMVGIGFAAKKNMVARVSVVNEMGEVLMDRYVRPREPVVNYRTEVSGIRPADIANGDEFVRVQADVAALLEGRILVGHAVYNDLKVLALQHPPKSIRDTSRYRPLINRVTGGSTPSLKTLARCVLDVNIQTGEHSSVEDARAAMRIYNRYKEEWERSARRRNN